MFPLTPGAAVPALPHPSHQQYPTHYQQQPLGATAVPQQSTTARPLFGTHRGQSLTPPIPQTNLPHPQNAPPGPAQPANTPLAYSTLNVNVSSQTQPLPGGVAPPTGSYQYPTPYPTAGSTPSVATPPSGSLGLQQKSFATGANAYPIQSYNKVMSSFVGGGSGQMGVARPTGLGTAHMGGAPRGIVRGSVNSTPPRPPHPLPHMRSNLTPPPGYPTQTGHSVPTPQLPQTGLPGGGATGHWPR